MTPASSPRSNPAAQRLLRIDPVSGSIVDARLDGLPAMLRRGDLVVVNDAATLPASLRGRTAHGDPVELRLLGRAHEGQWRGVLFGDGDWRARTEDRPAPVPLGEGSWVQFDGLSARIEAVSSLSPRLVDLRFDRRGAAFWSALYRHGRPVQYSHLAGPLRLGDVQTAYASRPWAAEAPSAGRPLTWGLLLEMLRRGVKVSAVTHAAGLSSTGDADLDACLPLPEEFEVRKETVEAIRMTQAWGGRVVAVGTTVVRSLEGAAALDPLGVLRPRSGHTRLTLQRGFHPRVVGGLLTGFHDPGSGHYALLQAFAAPELLERAYLHAERNGYCGHEFGDSTLILPEGSPRSS